MEIRIEQLVSAPPEAVWRVLTDIDAAPQRLRGVTKIERLSHDTGYQVGTRWRETRKMMGTEASEEMWVTALVENRSTEIAAAAHGMRYTTMFEITPRANGALLSMAFTGERDNPTAWSRFVGRLTAKLGEGASRKAMTQDLADIAAAAESLA